MSKKIVLGFVVVIVLCGLGLYVERTKIYQCIAETYLKNKMVTEYKGVAKLLNINSDSDSKNLVDKLLQKVTIPPVDLAAENQKLHEENQKLQDILTQKAKNVKGLLQESK